MQPVVGRRFTVDKIKTNVVTSLSPDLLPGVYFVSATTERERHNVRIVVGR